MALSVLICGSGPISDALRETPLGRGALQRHVAPRAAAAAGAATKVKPRLILVDRGLPGASELILKLRKTPPTIGSSIVVVAQGDFDTDELAMLENGANAVLRFPPGPDWEERLQRMLDVPVRKQVRVKADFEFAGEFENQKATGRVINLSRTGMLMECNVALSVGEPFVFKLEVGYDDIIEGKARLVRIAGPKQYGCEFLDMDAWAAKKIEIYVDQA
jgi:hypothetical protein